jgi:hypothetical protein
MRPYFFNRYRGSQAALSQQTMAYKMSQVHVAPPKPMKRVGAAFKKILKSILGFFGIGRRLAPWERMAIQAAKEKRARRRARNLRWWANDPGWHKECAR